MLMCLACGEFVRAGKADETGLPVMDECLDCGGQTFKIIHTEEVIRVEDD